MIRPSGRARGGIGEGLKRKMVEEEGQRAVFIDVESGGGPVRAPCPIRGPLNPGGQTPHLRLLKQANNILYIILY